MREWGDKQHVYEVCPCNNALESDKRLPVEDGGGLLLGLAPARVYISSSPPSSTPPPHHQPPKTQIQLPKIIVTFPFLPSFPFLSIQTFPHISRRDGSGADSVTSFWCRVWFGNIAWNWKVVFTTFFWLVRTLLRRFCLNVRILRMPLNPRNHRCRYSPH